LAPGVGLRGSEFGRTDLADQMVPLQTGLHLLVIASGLFGLALITPALMDYLALILHQGVRLDGLVLMHQANRSTVTATQHRGYQKSGRICNLGAKGQVIEFAPSQAWINLGQPRSHSGIHASGLQISDQVGLVVRDRFISKIIIIPNQL
jgi:hypothetical protein